MKTWIIIALIVGILVVAGFIFGFAKSPITEKVIDSSQKVCNNCGCGAKGCEVNGKCTSAKCTSTSGSSCHG